MDETSPHLHSPAQWQAHHQRQKGLSRKSVLLMHVMMCTPDPLMFPVLSKSFHLYHSTIASLSLRTVVSPNESTNAVPDCAKYDP